MKKICEQCGKEFETRLKKQKFCSNECRGKSNIKDLIGKKFGRLTVLKLDHIDKKYRKDRDIYENMFYYLCKCDCGNDKIVNKKLLTSGSTLSCGCLMIEKAQKMNLKHHKSQTRLYKVWQGIKQRCYNESCKEFKNYGGRGIKICQEWLDNFMNFYNWAMDNGYNENAKKWECSIDRIEVNDNYCPENCRWVDIKMQGRNKRNNHLITYNGITKTLCEWAEENGLTTEQLNSRLRLGWSMRKAITFPIQR